MINMERTDCTVLSFCLLFQCCNVGSCTYHLLVPDRCCCFCQEMTRVRKETAIFFESLIAGGWCHPADPNGRYWLMPCEVIIQLMRYARSGPFFLPWNANDCEDKFRSRWNHLLSQKRFKSLIAEKAKLPHKTIRELYGPNFWWKGAPTTLTQKQNGRGKPGGIKKITLDAAKAAKELANPTRDDPIRMAARKRDQAQAQLEVTMAGISSSSLENTAAFTSMRSTTASITSF